MSRSQHTKAQGHVPKKVKRGYRRSKKAKDKQALRRQGEDPDKYQGPERDRTNHKWNYL